MDLDTFSDINEKTAFQLGFLAFCKEAGLTEEQAIEFVAYAVKTAEAPRVIGQMGPTMNDYWNGAMETLTKSHPHGYRGSANDYLDKWYNPWTKNTDGMTPGEETLRTIGRGSLGVAAGAGTLAAGVAGIPAAYAALPTSVAGKLTGAGLLAGAGGLAYKGWEGVKGVANKHGDLIAMGLLGAIPAAGLVAGGALGHGLAKFQEPNVSDDEIKAKELASTYKTYTDRLKSRRMYQQYRQARQTGGA
jgi:hypothetical protein